MKLAVYGSLKSGFGNHSYLNGAKFLGPFVTPPKFTMISAGGFPIVMTDGNTPITTEVYETTDLAQLKRIFSLEGYTGIPGHSNNWYDTTALETPFGEVLMFVMSPGNSYSSGKKEITTGIWS